MSENIQLSVLDIENKYKFDYDEDSNPKGYIQWGSDNQLPKLYHTCYNMSSTLKAIIDGTVNYILGDDVKVNDDAAYWNKQVNRNGMSMREFIEAISFNLLLFNGFAYQVIYNKLGVPVEFFPLDFGRCRTNEDATKVYYSKKWGKYSTKFEEFDIWNPNNINTENPTQIFYYKNKKGNTIYPLPPYNGAIYDILTEIECSKYALNTVSKGFSAKYLIEFPETANLTDEQKRGIEQAIKTKFCGSDTDVNFMLHWRTNDQGITINKLESDETPERYVAIKDSARQNIFVSMKASPVLFGLPNATNGFSTDEYKDSYKLYQKSVVAPMQDIILEALAKTTMVENPVTIKPFDIDFERNNDNDNEEK